MVYNSALAKAVSIIYTDFGHMAEQIDRLPFLASRNVCYIYTRCSIWSIAVWTMLHAGACHDWYFFRKFFSNLVPFQHGMLGCQFLGQLLGLQLIFQCQ